MTVGWVLFTIIYHIFHKTWKGRRQIFKHKEMIRRENVCKMLEYHTETLQYEKKIHVTTFLNAY